jgi:hypothetical protein
MIYVKQLYLDHFLKPVGVRQKDILLVKIMIFCDGKTQRPYPNNFRPVSLFSDIH